MATNELPKPRLSAQQQLVLRDRALTMSRVGFSALVPSVTAEVAFIANDESAGWIIGGAVAILGFLGFTVDRFAAYRRRERAQKRALDSNARDIEKYESKRVQKIPREEPTLPLHVVRDVEQIQAS